MQSEESVDVDEAVQIAEDDQSRQARDIFRVATQMWQHLHDLGEEDPQAEQSECSRRVHLWPVLHRSGQQHELDNVDEQRRSLELSEVDDIESPPESAGSPVRFVGHDCEVTAPMSASPAEALTKVAEVLFQGRLDHRAMVELKCNVPAVRVHISGQAFVVVRVQGPAKPAVCREVCRELFGLEDLRAIGCCAARKS